MSRRIAAEFLGTALLVMAVVGSGIMAPDLTKDVALQLLANAIATGGALLGLITILALFPVHRLTQWFPWLVTSLIVSHQLLFLSLISQLRLPAQLLGV